MSNLIDESGEINWKTVIDLLGDGQTVEIPCEKEREFVRRAKQAVKRAEKQGLAVEVVRGEGTLRIVPRPAGGRAVADDTVSDGIESRTERQLERVQRREALRAERVAERGRDR